jgi:hypothetical protein
VTAPKITYPRVEPNPLAGLPCKYCGSPDIWVELRPRITARPLGTWSLAGAQLKTSAIETTWPWAVCGGCGHESEGKP